MTWFYAFCDSGWIYGFLLLYWESWVLPCSPSCMAESTHSSPGPMLPQSTTDPLRTLEYISAAEQGSRVRGHKKSGYTCKHGDFSSLTAVVRPSSVQEQETWLLTLCATDMNFSELFKHDVAPSYYLETQTKKKSVPQRVHNGILYNFETIQKEYLKLLGNTSFLQMKSHYTTLQHYRRKLARIRPVSLTICPSGSTFWQWGKADWQKQFFQGRKRSRTWVEKHWAYILI